MPIEHALIDVPTERKHSGHYKRPSHFEASLSLGVIRSIIAEKFGDLKVR
jgi:hypothetical protein